MTTLKELKKDAKVRLSGNYFKLIVMNALFLVIILAFFLLRNYIKNSTLKLLYTIIIAFFNVPLSFGLLSTTMDIVRGSSTNLTEFINVGFKNILKVWKVFFRVFLKLLIPLIVFWILSVSLIFAGLAYIYSNNVEAWTIYALLLTTFASLIWLIIASFKYVLALYVLKDNPNQNGKEIVEGSSKLIKGHILNYIGLYLSFIGWYILILLICSIVLLIISYFNLVTAEYIDYISYFLTTLGELILLPYISATVVGFYDDLVYDKTSKEEKAE